MKKSGMAMFAVSVASSLLLASAAFAETAEPVKGVAASAAIQASATVTAIDHKTREVTLKTADGREETFVVDEAAKNFDQVNKGDVVTVTYTEAIAYEVMKGAAGAAAGTAVVGAKAAAGEKPAGIIARETTVMVTITAIDEKAPSVTFQGPKGNTRTVKVKDPAKLKDVKVGDSVQITYTEALALTVDKAPAK